MVYKIFILAFLLNTAFVGSSYANPRTGLAGWWKFDDGSGASASDSSGNGSTGALQNAPTWVTNCPRNGCLNFNGTNQGVNFTTTSSKVNSLSALTISAWIYPTGDGGGSNGRVINKANVSSPSGTNMYWGINMSTTTFQFRAGWTTAGLWIPTTATVPFNAWSLIVITYSFSSTANNPIIYINGTSVTVTTTTTPVGSTLSDDTTMAIGDWGNGTRSFSGRIDDVRVYNRILSPTEVNELFSNGVQIRNAHISNAHINQ